ncbi:hypothetical protein LDENG_00168730, partial [Lucifuga dentata]
TSAPPCPPPSTQFSYQSNRSTRDAIAQVLHTTLSHLNRGCGDYVFIDYSLAFNIIVPHTLSSKLQDLEISRTSHCNWVQDFLTGRPQKVQVGHMFSSKLTLNTAPPSLSR